MVYLQIILTFVGLDEQSKIKFKEYLDMQVGKFLTKIEEAESSSEEPA